MKAMDLAAINAAVLSLALVVPSIVMAQDRLIGLEGQPNFRDLGGYKTYDGERVRTGLVYRSGELPSLPDADVEPG